MSKYPVVNCDMCGRDTDRRSRICKTCMGGVSRHTAHERTETVAELFVSRCGVEDVEIDVPALKDLLL